MQLRSDQQKGVEFLLSTNRSILADEMGVGKTAQLITAAIQSNSQRIAVVTPLAVVDHWNREIDRWAPETVIIPLTKLGYYNSLLPQFTVFNYDIIHKYGRAISEWADCFIVDESHYVMNHGQLIDVKSGKYKGVRRTAWVNLIATRVISRNGIVWLASGSPMPARPSQLISQLQVLNRLSQLGSWKDYVTRYCNGHQQWITVRGGGRRKIWDITGATNLQELNQKLSPFMLRRTRAEVLPDILLMQPQIIYTTLNGYEVEYARAYDEIVNYVYDRYRELEGDEEARIRAIKAEAGKHLVEFTNLRRILGEAKLNTGIEWIKEYAESGRQLVVFTHHRHIIETFAKEFPGNSQLYGGMTEENRRLHLEQFQNKQTQLLFANTLSAGIGINLANASDVLFMEYEWTVNSHRQALDRCARPPQTEPVASYWLTVDGTLDLELQSRISEQAVSTNTVMGDTIAGDVMAALLAKKTEKGSIQNGNQDN